MTGNKLLLDTNIVIEIFEGNKTFADNINGLSEFYISSVVLGELYVGINRVTNKIKHIKKLNSFLKLCTVLNADRSTAKHYGTLIANLYKKGIPIPTNDVWIAAIAIQHKLTLITLDKHFNEIEGLKLKKW
jgi:tRNA(fMet)-specific endonuclease VapC